MSTPSTLCRDCLAMSDQPGRCNICGSPRSIQHAELLDLSTAHIDCDAFYASVEKRDNPELASVPLIVGGGRRGVVTTACYLARTYGVKSAMPMFQARKLCPDAVIVKPRMSYYIEISREIRAMMMELTPLVEPLSLDEAFLDLSGTERLHGAPPAILLARLQSRIERDLALTVSVGLSHNKFLAKIASDLDKPRGFAVIGRAETKAFLAAQPVSLIWGVGKSTRAALEAAGIRTIADLQRRERKRLIEQFGPSGDRLWHLAEGKDNRPVSATQNMKSISNESTFPTDIEDLETLEAHLWRMCEKVSARAKAKGIVGRVVTLKLKRADHRVITRRQSLDEPTQLAHILFETSRIMLQRNIENFSFRLIGLGISNLTRASETSADGDLLKPAVNHQTEVERVTDQIRARFGDEVIGFGRSLR
ncbi:MAG: DNA polymerase IV [Pseudomonadota bacterium]